MKKLILYLMLCVSVIACNDSDDGVDAGQAAKNKFRVKEISGKNDYWGEYTMKFTYYGERVDSALVYNEKNDKIAVLTESEDDKSRTYYVADYVPGIDPDSVRKLEDKYGELAKDSIPMVTRNLFTVKTEYTEGVMMAQEFSWYRPREDVGTGASFNNKYLNNKRVRYIYEYNAAGVLNICRVFYDVFEEDVDDNAEFTRKIYKAMLMSDEAGKLSSVDWYEGDEQYQTPGSYKLTDRYQPVYTGDLLTMLGGEHLKLQYQYAGNLVSLIDNSGKVVKYGYSTDGYLNKVEQADGSYLNVKYEQGNGNFTLFTSLLEQRFNVPYIR